MSTKWLLAAMPKALSERERRHFLQVFGRQPQFGNLPLPLLVERYSVLGPVLNQLVEDPENQELVGTLHALLQIYAEMCSNRRRADRKSKKRARLGKRGLEYTGVENLLNLQECQAAPTSTGSDRFTQIAAVLAFEKGAQCKSCGEVQNARISSGEHTGNDDDLIEIELICGCGEIRCLEVTRDNFAEAGRQVG